MSATPHILVTDVIVDDDTLRVEQLKDIARKYVPLQEFRDAPMDVLRVSVLSGGITNQLYRVQIAGPSSNINVVEEGGDVSVVVRVFGKETERIISRESELFYQSLFLRTFCQGKNFLVYEFLTGFKDIDFTEMPTHRVAIAEKFAEFHSTATFNSKSAGRFDKEVLSCRDTLRAWSSSALGDTTMSKLTDEQRATLAISGMTREAVAQHVTDLLSAIHSVDEDLVVGVCHNDLLCANIMRRVAPSTSQANKGDLVFIDFEYGNRNYLLYDLANHFNEYVGLECNYDRHFPSDDVILESIVSYRLSMRALYALGGGPLPFGEAGSSLFFCENDEAELQRCLQWVQYVKLLTLASNAMWACWAVLQAAHSVIDFDFAAYATQRWKRFLSTKDVYIASGVGARCC
jgi:ethanolamine kinase